MCASTSFSTNRPGKMAVRIKCTGEEMDTQKKGEIGLKKSSLEKWQRINEK